MGLKESWEAIKRKEREKISRRKEPRFQMNKFKLERIFLIREESGAKGEDLLFLLLSIILF